MLTFCAEVLPHNYILSQTAREPSEDPVVLRIGILAPIFQSIVLRMEGGAFRVESTVFSGGGNRVVMRRVGYEIKWSLGWLLFF